MCRDIIKIIDIINKACTKEQLQTVLKALETHILAFGENSHEELLDLPPRAPFDFQMDPIFTDKAAHMWIASFQATRDQYIRRVVAWGKSH